MTRIPLLCAAVVALAACDPVSGSSRPAAAPDPAPSSGIRVSGEARVGISITRADIDHWAVWR